MPCTPRMPLHRNGTNLCLVITISLQNCTRQPVTAAQHRDTVRTALKYAIHRYQARQTPCPNTGDMPPQVKRLHLARCQKSIRTVTEMAVRSLPGHGIRSHGLARAFAGPSLGNGALLLGRPMGMWRRPQPPRGTTCHYGILQAL